jgi:hypothetical protein
LALADTSAAMQHHFAMKASQNAADCLWLHPAAAWGGQA